MLANRDRSHVGACGPARLRRGDIFICLFVCVCVYSFFGISIYDLSVYLAYAMVHHFGLYIYIYYDAARATLGYCEKKNGPR